MKQTTRSRIQLILARIFNVRAWADFDRVKSFTNYLANGFKRMFVPQTPQKGESFKAAAARLGISEQALMGKKTALYRLSILMCITAACIFLYTLYQLIYGSYRATIISLVITLIALVLAYRYHFWYFQIKERKLGCSFDEWYKQGLRGDK